MFTLIRQRAALRRTGRPRLGYISGAGDSNLGDEAMLEAAHQLFPAHALVPMAYPRQEKRLERCGFSGSRFWDGIIVSGGTLINPYWWPQVKVAIDQKVPVWSLGTGVGSQGFPVPESIDLTPWQGILPRFTGLGLRGPLSQERLEAIGIGNGTVVGDLAFALTRPPVAPQNPPCFALNVYYPVRPEHGDESFESLDELAQCVAGLVARGWRPVPIAMHRHDIEPTQRILDAAGVGDIPIQLLPDFDSFYRVVAPCTLLVGVRLHAAILAFCAGVPPLVLGYRDKALDFVRSVEWKEWYVPLDKAAPGEIEAKCRRLAEQAVELRPLVHQRAKGWQDKLQQYADEVRQSLPQR